jgi:hypothetical protein
MIYYNKADGGCNNHNTNRFTSILSFSITPSFPYCLISLPPNSPPTLPPLSLPHFPIGNEAVRKRGGKIMLAVGNEAGNSAGKEGVMLGG